MSSTPRRAIKPADVPPRLKQLLLASVGVITAASIAGAAFAPVLLIKAPLVLLALSPDGRHVALAVETADPVAIIAVATLRRLCGLIVAYGLGVVYGPAAVSWGVKRMPRFGRVIRYAERLFARFGAPLLLVMPTLGMCVLAGAARTRFWVFLLAASLGQLALVSLTYLFGDWISEATRPILAFISKHLLETTLACVLLVGVYQVVSMKKRRGRKLDMPIEGEPSVDETPARQAASESRSSV